jgi:CysZ protein
MGFFRGIRAFFEGVGFVARTPRLWALALVPAITAMVLSLALGLTAGHYVSLWAHRTFGDGFGGTLFAVGAMVAVVLLAIVLAVSMAQPLSGWALDAIVRTQASALGLEPFARQSLLTTTMRSAASSFIALMVGLPTIAALGIVGWFVPPAAIATVPLKVVVTGLLLAWDLLDYPLALRGISLGARLVWCVRHLGAVMGFGLAATLFFAIPGLGLLALPCGVAAATRLAASR